MTAQAWRPWAEMALTSPASGTTTATGASSNGAEVGAGAEPSWPASLAPQQATWPAGGAVPMSWTSAQVKAAPAQSPDEISLRTLLRAIAQLGSGATCVVDFLYELGELAASGGDIRARVFG